eukprot:gene10976-12139_t
MEALETKLKQLLEKYDEKNEASFDIINVKQDLNSLAEVKDVAKHGMHALRKQRLNAEHQLSQLEKQLISCNSKLEKETSEGSRVKKLLEEQGNSLEEKQAIIRSLDDEKTDLHTNYNKALKSNAELEDGKVALVELLEKKGKEVDRLNEEWKSMSKKLSDTTNAKYEAQSKLDEIKSSEFTKEFKLKRLEQEKDLLTSQNAHLSAELNAKADELIEIKKNKANEVLDLQAMCDKQAKEIQILQSNLENVTKTSEEQEEKIIKLIERLKQAREEMAKSEDHMERELAAKTKLVELYKESSEHSKRKITEMTVALEELKKLYNKAEERNTQLTSELELVETDRKAEVKEFDVKIKQLVNELENANDLLEVARKKAPTLSKESLDQLSPSAAVASALIKKGMTLTQIYSEYVTVSDELEVQKDENARLKQYLDQILQEIEEKAPILQHQKEDYESCLKTIENLTTKFESALTKCERFRAEHEEATRKLDAAKRENQRLNVLCSDLGQQTTIISCGEYAVRILIKEVEEARGGLVSSQYETPSIVSSDTVSSSSQVISEHLVSFRNIEELQEQNQKLLAVVRDLSEEREKQEKDCSPEKMKELSSKLDFAFDQVKQLKEEREKQENIIHTLVKQRDMYKVLYNVEDRPEISSSSFMQQSMQVTSAEADEEVKKTKAYLDKALEEYEKYKKESKEKECSLEEKIEKIEEKTSSLRIENQSLKGKLEFLEEKNNMQQKTNEGLKREANALTEKSRGLETALSKAQKEAVFYKQELELANDKRINAEVSVKSLAAEKRLIKETEQRLMQENKTLVEHQRSRNVLLTNLQTIQNNLERQEFTTRNALGGQIENLQLELKSLRKKMESEEMEKKTNIGSLSEQVKQLNMQLDGERNTRRETEEIIEQTKKELDAANQKCSTLQQQLTASESRLESLVDQDDNKNAKLVDDLKKELEEKSKIYQAKLNEEECRLKALQSQVQSVSRHSEQYKQIAASSEEALKDATQKYSLLEQDFKQKLALSTKAVDELKIQLGAAKCEIESRKTNSEKAQRDLQFQLDETRGSLATLDAEFNAVKSNVDSFKEQADLARAEAREHASIAQEKQDKYERELVLHAKDVEELVKIKEKLHGYSVAVGDSDAKIREAEEKMAATEKAMEEMKSHHAEESKKIIDHSKQIAQQNSLLHKEIEKLSEQIAAEKTQKIDDIAKLTEGSVKSADKSTEDLYEVIRFLRREKEIAETKCEAAQSESIRYRQRCEYHENELEETQSALQLERRRTQGQMLTVEEHAELTSKVSQVAELTETNAELEKCKSQLEQTNNVLTDKTQKLEEELEPLRQSKKLLEEEKGSLIAEKAALKSEIQRWTARTQQLIEQSNKASSVSDELKQLQKSKAQNDKIVGALKDEISRMKTQKETMTKEMLKMKKDASEYQGKVTLLTTLADTIKAEREEADKRFTQEIEILNKTNAEQVADIGEKAKLIARLKSLARKYKVQYEESLKSSGTGEVQANTTGSAEESSKQPLSDEEKKRLNEEIEKLQGDLKNAEHKVKELNSKIEDSSRKDKNASDDIIGLKNEIEKLTKENAASKVSLTESEEKVERNRKVLRSVKEKINDLNAQKDKLSNETADLKKQLKDEEDSRKSSEDSLKEKEMRLNILKSQYDTTMEKMQAELNRLKEENKALSDRLQELEEEKRLADENSEELTKAITESEDIIAKLKANQASVKPIHDHNIPDSAAFAPLTATVRPTSADHLVASQAQKGISSRTASIKPLIPSATPTAMVSPTVPPLQPSATQVVNPIVNTAAQDVVPEQRGPHVPDVVPGPSRGQASVFKAPRIVMAAVQAQEGGVSEPQATVAPIVAGETAPSQQQEEGEEIEDSEHVVDDDFEARQVDIEAVELGDAEEIPDERQQSPQRAEERQSETMPDVTPVSGADFLPLEVEPIFIPRVSPLLSSHAQSQEGTSSVKRRRSVESDDENEEDVTTEEEPEEKRQRIQEEPRQLESHVEDEVISISDGEVVEPEYDEDEEGREEAEYGHVEEGVVEDEDDEDEEMESEASMHEIQEEGDDDDESYVFEEPAFSVEEEEDEEEEGEIEADDGIEDVEEIEDEEEEVEENIEDEDEDDNTGVPEPSISSSRAITDVLTLPSRDATRELQRRQPSPAAFMLAAQEQSGRGRAFRRRYQLPSFSLPPGQGGNGPFDDAEDCTVPSTPTLYEPKRSDGFAEAVSSPQVRQPVFSFPGGPDGTGRAAQVSGLGVHVTDEGLRLDDTRIDLLAGEVPVTPMGIVPSVAVIPVSRSNDVDEVVSSRQHLVQGRARQSSTALVPEMSADFIHQEQNVPQQIDLTADDDEEDDDDEEGDDEDEDDEEEDEEEEREEEEEDVDEDEDDDEQDDLSTGMQEDDIFEESQPDENKEEEVEVEQIEDQKETQARKEEQQPEPAAGNQGAQVSQESKVEKEEEPKSELSSQDVPAASTMDTKATTSAPKQTTTRRPKLRRTVLAGRVAASTKPSNEEKSETS